LNYLVLYSSQLPLYSSFIRYFASHVSLGLKEEEGAGGEGGGEEEEEEEEEEEVVVMVISKTAFQGNIHGSLGLYEARDRQTEKIMYSSRMQYVTPSNSVHL
jgi:hypothetical protein